MTGRVPIRRTTRQLIVDSRARQEELAAVRTLLASARGIAHDVDDMVEVTADPRGKLLSLWLAPTAAKLGARLGPLIVEVAEVATREAIQHGYNLVALRLGADLTYLIEQLSGVPAPARSADDSGITAAEFQWRRDERMAESSPRANTKPSIVDDDVHQFDPATLRSDR